MGEFSLFFAYKIFNIDVETTKIVPKMQIMGRNTKKIIFFYKNATYSKLHFTL